MQLTGRNKKQTGQPRVPRSPQKRRGLTLVRASDLTIEETASFLRLGKRTVFLWIKLGKLTGSYRVLRGRPPRYCRLIPVESVLAAQRRAKLGLMYSPSAKAMREKVKGMTDAELEELFQLACRVQS